MIEKHFEEITQTHLPVAQVGIHKSRWTAVSESTDKSVAKKLMVENQYDIIPVQHQDKITHYYATLQRGHFSGDIEKCEIKPEDKIYYLSHIEDVMTLFEQQNRHFFFLWDYQQILGLISAVNLRSTSVYMYLYALSHRLETALSQLFLLAYSEEEFRAVLVENAKLIQEQSDREKREQYLEDVFARHEDAKAQNEHLHLIEQLNLYDLFDVLRKQKWLVSYGYTNGQLSSLCKKIRDLRNHIAHPVKSQIKTSDMLTFIRQTRQLIPVIKSAELDVHYRKTRYLVFGHKIPIEIDKQLPASLAKLRQSKTGWCYITAFNPGSKPLDDSINALLNENLKKELENSNYVVYEGQGESTTVSNYPPEKSFFVPDIPLEDAKRLGQKYGQNAIVYGEKNKKAELIKLNSET